LISEKEIRAALPQAFSGSSLPLPNKQAGKVRDGYPLAKQRRLLVTTDRLSAFDRILACVPFKGQVLNQLSAWWFEQTADVIQNHLLALPDPNAIVALEAKPFTVEVVVRGYITGVTTTALWYRYALGEREIYGYRFPDGLRKESGAASADHHADDESDWRRTRRTLDVRRGCRKRISRRGDLGIGVQAAALAVFKRGQEISQRAGLILVDTKYEFGYRPMAESC